MSNERVSGIGPRTTSETLWKTTATGGWNGDHSFTIDISEKYLFFVWLYKESLIGTLSISLDIGYQGTLINNATGVSDSTPMFIDSLSWRSGGSLYGYEEQWLFCCGYIFPSTTANTVTTNSGIYTSKGVKIYSGVDFRWNTDPTPWEGEVVKQTCSENNVIYFARPSFYLCDDYEPNIKRMIGL